MNQNIFVMGLDDSNRALLEALPDAERFTFHQLLTFEELQDGPVSVPKLLEKARRQLEAFEDSIDAITGAGEEADGHRGAQRFGPVPAGRPPAAALGLHLILAGGLALP